MPLLDDELAVVPPPVDPEVELLLAGGDPPVEAELWLAEEEPPVAAPPVDELDPLLAAAPPVALVLPELPELPVELVLAVELAVDVASSGWAVFEQAASAAAAARR